MTRHKNPKSSIPFWDVPKLWIGGTVLCIAGGPSLTQEDCYYAARFVDGIIGINDAYRMYPQADILYGCDYKWWKWHYEPASAAWPGAVKVTGQAQTLSEFADVKLVRVVHNAGWSLVQNTVHAGGHGGYHAINIAILAGAKRIVLLGYDMQPASAELAQRTGIPMGAAHWFGSHPDKTRQDFAGWLSAFQGTDAAAKRLGVEIINATRETALTEFQQMPLSEALK